MIVARILTLALWSAVRATLLCETGSNEEEEPGLACAGVPPLPSPDKHKLAASKILTAARGKRENLDKPKRLRKYLLRQKGAKSQDSGTARPTNSSIASAGTEPAVALPTPTVAARLILAG